MKRILITSALPYANGNIHLGHLAGAYLPADIYARFMRLIGSEVLYICASDEHGVAITISAENENTTPKNIIDKYHKANLLAFSKFGMSFDFYSRTSNKLHHEVALNFFEKLLSNGFLAEKTTEQFYDNEAKMFLPDRYVEGTCPECGYDKARGDQCDKCGAYYDQIKLTNPISTVSKTTPIVKETTHWYLKLSVFQEFLEAYIDSNEGIWKDNVIQQAKAWFKMGLEDRAITRDLSWGVSIEKAKGLDKEKTKGKVLYVWFDAVLGYITATMEWAKKISTKEIGITENDWKKWWQDEQTEHIAFIGKDNIVFHSIMLPAIEMAYGGYTMPTNIPANEFLNLEGQKFSKSRNWSIDLQDFITDFETTQAVDTLRYSLSTILPENKDADFTWKDYQAKTNNELAAIFGNFVNRTLQFVMKNMDGKVPVLSAKYKNMQNILKNIEVYYQNNKHQSAEDIKNHCNAEFSNQLSQNDINLFLYFIIGIDKIEELYKKFKIKDAVNMTMNLARASNKYFNDEEPWKTIKTDDIDYCNKTVYICCQSVYILSVMFAPIIPYTSAKIQNFFGVENILGTANNGIKTINYIKQLLDFNIPEGTKIINPTILFTQIEDSVIDTQMKKMG